MLGCLLQISAVDSALFSPPVFVALRPVSTMVFAELPPVFDLLAACLTEPDAVVDWLPVARAEVSFGLPVLVVTQRYRKPPNSASKSVW